MCRATFLVLTVAGFVTSLTWAEDGEAPEFRIAGTAFYCEATIVIGPNKRGASSAAPQGKAVILYDPEIMATLPYLEPFVYAHECAHHALGHTSPAGLLREGHAFREKELAADCWAAETLVASGEANIVREQIELFRSQADQRSGPRYPLYTERAAKLAACALK